MNHYLSTSVETGSSGSREGGAIARVLCSLLVSLCFICGPLLLMESLTRATAQAEGVPGGNIQDPVVRAVDIARPAVVRIVTQIQGRLTVQFSAARSVTFPLDGGSYALAALGTGTFISAHGDILTADHVINPPHDNELNAVLIRAAAPDVAAYYNRVIGRGQPLSADQMEQALLNGQFLSQPSYATPVSAVYLSTDYSGPLTASRLRDVPETYFAQVDRVEQESPPDQKDIAIIHVNMEDTPSVELGDSSAVQVQDNLTIIGFPGNADVSMRPTDFLTSSVNRIFVSSIKTTDSGAQVIQVGGNVEQGDSGGPALDSQGHVVGIVSFGTPGGTSFLQASNSARVLIQNLHLNTEPGPFQRAWSQAFNDYASTAPGHWHRAAQEFAVLAARYPAFKAVVPYLNYARQQAAHEQVPATTNQSHAAAPLLIALGGLGIVAIAMLAWGTIFVLRRRRGPTAVTPAMASPLTVASNAPGHSHDGTAYSPPQKAPSAPAFYPQVQAGAPSPRPPLGSPPSTDPAAPPVPQTPWPAPPGGQISTPPQPPTPAGLSASRPASQQPSAAQAAFPSHLPISSGDEETLVPFGGPPRAAGTRGQPEPPRGGQAPPRSTSAGNQSAAPSPPSSTAGSQPIAWAGQASPSAPRPSTEQLRLWPCGHMNRPHARYCSTCGEPAPSPPTVRRIEQ
ncbi:trypsin-like peptidase domain-containing protein [Thermogemmatispora sp.]|uniref:trypsin-like peptidase domain-containing protein n=1 Tax=Thermogemmatispora sp. TaxID=1968838 RepID=UPI001D7F499A|nr:trypsin-like peptidase domain-containing protein [Thermogemmatispora sp.]MBX5449950.1 trypsin-like peptidase domain-containing protein [Thermogemmatispora sp.]